MEKENKKRRKRRSNAGYIVVILILITLISLLVYEHFFPIRKLPAGTWMHEDDLTADTENVIAEWLSTGEAGLSDDDLKGLADVPSDRISVNVMLKISDDGAYEQYVEKDSYDRARETAYNNLQAGLEALIGARFRAVGLTDGSDIAPDELAALMQEAVGMSMEDYLQKAVADIMPSYDEYARKIDRKGTCRIEEGTLILDEDKGHTFLFDDNRLLLDDVVYVRVEDAQ